MDKDFNILVGPAMSGKTYKLCRDTLEQAYENPDKNYVYVVPDQAGNEYEKKLINMNRALFGRPGFMNIDILGFNRMAHKIFADMGVSDTSVLEEYEKNMLVRVAAGRVEKSLNVYGGSIDRTGFTSEMKSLISEFIQYDVTPEDLDKAVEEVEAQGSASLAAKLRDVIILYREFLNVLGTMNSGIAEDRLKTVIKLLKSDKKCSVVDGGVFIFDEFRGYTPDQLGVIAEISKRAEKVTFGICAEPSVIRAGAKIKEHDIFRQSCETYRSLQEIMGRKPSVIYMETDRKDSLRLSHLRKHLFRYPVVEFAASDEEKKEDNDIEIYSCSNPQDEVRVAAEKIRALVKKGLRYKDITVATGDIESFEKYSSRIFVDFDIPFFMDYSRKMRKNPFTEALIRFIDIAVSDYSYDSIFGFVKTGVLDLEETETLDNLENHVIKTGMRGRKMWEKEIRPYIAPGSDRKINEDEEKLYSDMEEVRQKLLDVFSPLKVFSGKKKVSEYIKALREMTENLDYEHKLEKASGTVEAFGLLTDARIMNSLYSVIERLFTETEELLGEVEMSPSEFAEIFESGINDLKVGVIPPTVDCVHVCDIDRSRIIETKALIVTGANDGIIPAKKSSGRILSDKDKTLVSEILSNQEQKKTLAPAGVKQSIDELFLIYQLFSKPSQKLIISYVNEGSDGDAREPSFLVGRIARLFPDMECSLRMPKNLSGTPKSDKLYFIENVRDMLEEIHSNKGDRSRRYEDSLRSVTAYLDYIEAADIPDKDEVMPGLDFSNRGSEIPAGTMNNLDIKLSVSKIESYAGCPYEFFLRYILSLRERPERKIEYYDIGNILHRALEMTFEEIKDKHGNDWVSTDDETLVSIMDSFLDKAWEEADMKKFHDEEDGKTMETRRRLKALSERTIKTLRKHIRAGEMIPDRFEQSFTAEFEVCKPDGEMVPIYLSGKIDRLDMKEEEDRIFIRVIDYKTSNKDFKPEEIREGTDIQLSVYTRIITEILQRENKDKKIIPAGMYFYHVNNPLIEPASGKQVTECGGDEVMAADKKIDDALKMRGVSDMSPNISSEEKSEDGDYPHRFLNLHDRELVSPETGVVLKKSKTVPVSGKNGSIEDSSLVLETEDMFGIGDYSLIKMRTEAEKILAGKFAKNPVRYDSTGRSKCEYCGYKSVCRFNAAAGEFRRVPKTEGSKSQQLISLSETAELQDKTEIKKSRMINNP